MNIINQITSTTFFKYMPRLWKLGKTFIKVLHENSEVFSKLLHNFISQRKSQTIMSSDENYRTCSRNNFCTCKTCKSFGNITNFYKNAKLVYGSIFLLSYIFMCFICSNSGKCSGNLCFEKKSTKLLEIWKKKNCLHLSLQMAFWLH